MENAPDTAQVIEYGTAAASPAKSMQKSNTHKQPPKAPSKPGSIRIGEQDFEELDFDVNQNDGDQSYPGRRMSISSFRNQRKRPGILRTVPRDGERARIIIPSTTPLSSNVKRTRCLTNSTRNKQFRYSKLKMDNTPISSILVKNIDNGNDNLPELEELGNFASYFKRKRLELGLTQGYVGLAMNKEFGLDFSQTTISRFEALNLSFQNMCKLMPIFQRWVSNTENSMANGVDPQSNLIGLVQSDSEKKLFESIKKRRKRTSLNKVQRNFLISNYHVNPRPDSNLLANFAKQLGLDMEIVRVWFCNRRQKYRRDLSLLDEHPKKFSLLLFSNPACSDGTSEAIEPSYVPGGNVERLSSSSTEKIQTKDP